MRVKLLSVWGEIRSSYWFVPSLMAVGALLLSLGMIELDSRVSAKWLREFGWLYLNQADGARALLSTVAGSMITVAGVAFSSVMVVLSLTSSQFGPRLIRNFMRDTGNQVVLGTFVATFLYCLLILRTIRQGESSAFVPHLSIILAVVLAAASIGVFIYFIHHTAESIQVSNVLGRVSHSLETTVVEKYPDKKLLPGAVGRGLKEASLEEMSEEASLEKMADESSGNADEERSESENLDERLRDSLPDLGAAAIIPAAQSGYLQYIDEKVLMRLACEYGVVFELAAQPGAFLLTGVTLVRVWPDRPHEDAFEKALRGAFVLGAHRTQAQDVDFLFDQLVEVGLRALSPGINDPFTAMMCIDRIASALHLLDERDLPSPYRADDEGRLRVVVHPVSAPALVARTLGPFRRYGSDSLLVLTHLLSAIKTLLSLTRTPEFRRALLREAALVKESGCEGFIGADCGALTLSYQEAVGALGTDPAQREMSEAL